MILHWIRTFSAFTYANILSKRGFFCKSNSSASLKHFFFYIMFIVIGTLDWQISCYIQIVPALSCQVCHWLYTGTNKHGHKGCIQWKNTILLPNISHHYIYALGTELTGILCLTYSRLPNQAQWRYKSVSNHRQFDCLPKGCLNIKDPHFFPFVKGISFTNGHAMASCVRITNSSDIPQCSSQNQWLKNKVSIFRFWMLFCFTCSCYFVLPANYLGQHCGKYATC